MPLPLPAPCSIPKTVLRGSAFYVHRGAASASLNFMRSPAKTMHLVPLPLFRSCFATGSICFQPILAKPRTVCSQPSHLCHICEANSPPYPPARCCNNSGSVSAATAAWMLPAAPTSICSGNFSTNLPEGEQDLNGPSLDAALEDLFALPDPAASSECGVQLMTIHKSKGLEFEVVLVPDLHARGGNNKPELLSWLERGIAEPEESDDLTEFLVAPLQFKGDDRGKARQWVDRIRRERESQETRRILYVAATRAREELHLLCSTRLQDRGRRITLFAGTAQLPASNSMARTGRRNSHTLRRVERRKLNIPPQTQMRSSAQSPQQAQGNLVFMPSPSQPTFLRRLPPEFQTSPAASPTLNLQENIIGLSDANPYQRHQGGQVSRALGNAVHKLLEELARLRVTLDWDSATEALEKLRPRITASIRSAGVSLAQAENVTAQAFECALNAARDPFGQWILSPHATAFSESGWAGIVSGNLRLVRVDRLFRAGLEPLQPGNEALWIIDYKTSHIESIDPSSALPAFRANFAPQLQMYAAVLRNLHSPDQQLRAGLYYPRMSLFDWWEI